MKHNILLWKYLNSKNTKIEGWLSHCDALIIGSLLEFQINNKLLGSVVEIGVHHGKSFIPMVISNNSINSYAIDIFENQLLNVDGSGKGNKNMFFLNLKKWFIAPENICVDARLSSMVKSEEIIDAVGKARFFHIDGGHHFDAVKNDIELAYDVIKDFGVIAIDDVFRPEWPEVSIALFSSRIYLDKKLLPFAIGHNKTYLCKPEFVKIYQSVLLENPQLKVYLNKEYSISGQNVLIFQTHFLPNFGNKKSLLYFLELLFPKTIFRLLNLKKKIN